MSRDIRFRIWDKKKKFFWYPRCNGDTTFHEVFADEESIPQQFTGLLDKNGKEIYEGDILESGYREPHKIHKPVIFYHGSFYFGGNSLSKYVIIEKTMRVPSVEIIGNIFENPELLK